MVLEVRADDRASGKPVFTATTSMFVTGEGGFGGDRGPTAPKLEPPPRAPDRRVSWTTLPFQTLLWRHAGNDPNRIHFDPAAARSAGFDAPILMGLNKEVALSSGSACTSSTLEPSYVIQALGVGADLAHSSIRYGLHRFTTDEEVDFVGERTIDVVKKLREMSPLYELAKEGVDLKSIQWKAE